MLIATDSRWSVVAGPIIEAIESTGIVPAEELDLLARAFISADTNVYWKCPDDWFSTTGFVISEVTGSPDPHELDPKNSDTSGPTVAARAIAPCLRRWAAARSLRLDPSIWHAVVARASEIGGSGGGGLMRGLLDSIESLPPEGRSLVGRMALKSGRADVRHEALRQLAHTDWALARMLGLRDANERVRRWASDLVDPSTLSAASEKPPAGAPARTKNSSRGQGFLFE